MRKSAYYEGNIVNSIWDRNQRNIVMAVSELGSHLQQNISKQSYEFSKAY